MAVKEVRFSEDARNMGAQLVKEVASKTAGQRRSHHRRGRVGS